MLTARLCRQFLIRYVKRRQTFETGQKPDYLQGVRPSQRAWQCFLGRQQRENPIRVADRFLAQARLPSCCTYAQVADHFGVSRVMVSNHLALLTRLPGNFLDWLRSCDDPMMLGYFTERRLRPVTRIKVQAKQAALLDQMVMEAQVTAGKPAAPQ